MAQYRPAAGKDVRAIRALIHRVKINPIGIDWRRFLVAIDEHGAVIGCGQVKPHQDGTQELASIAVRPERQGQGIGREIVHRLLAKHPGPLYLTCRAQMGAFYEQFGFQRVPLETIPPYFRRISRAHRLLRLIVPGLDDLFVMFRQG